jgi:catalase
LKVGTLTISSAMPEKRGGNYGINLDPLTLADGIAATNDSVLLLRSPSYGVSHTRRLQSAWTSREQESVRAGRLVGKRRAS